MPGLFALLSAVTALAALPALPERGLALETRAGVELQTLGGKPLATLPGLDLALDQATAHRLVLRDRAGGLFTLVDRRLQLRPQRRGCRETDVALVVCARTIRHDGRVVARAAGNVGHWVWAELAPRSGGVLAQWSAECEIPVAYLVADGRLHSVGDETVALGWLPDGSALIHFRAVGCAGSAHGGIYAVRRTGKRRLVLRTPPLAQYLMWGG